MHATQSRTSRTKAFRGDVPLKIRTDSHSIIDKAKSKSLYDSDMCPYRRWVWLIANERGFKIEFVKKKKNQGADPLSRQSD